MSRLYTIHGIRPMPFVPCPTSGGGVHTWLLAEANRCRLRGLKPTQTERILLEGSAGCGRVVDQREIDDALRKAYEEPASRGPIEPAASYDPAALKRVAEGHTEANEAWLWSRSPVLPDTVSPPEFLNTIFGLGARALVFDAQQGKPLTWTCGRFESLDKWLDIMNHWPNVFFLCNPVDGEAHLNPRTGRMSRRSAESITEFRYGVIESDEAPADLWLSAVVQLRLPITAIYTSGGKSIHVLWRVGAKTKDEWDDAVRPWRRNLVTLGADPAALTAVRLSRLPGCKRNSTDGFQKLLYLNPQPTIWPLTEVEVIR
jgi:hypothetical protein